MTVKDAPRLSRLGILRADIEKIVEETKAKLNAGIEVKPTPSQAKSFGSMKIFSGNNL